MNNFAQEINFGKLLIPTAMIVGLVVLFSILFVLTTKKRRSEVFRRHWFAGFLYLLFIGSVALLSATAFGSILQHGHMEGYPLLLHTIGAGAFVFLLLAVAFFYLPRASLTKDNWIVERWSIWIFIGVSSLTTATMLLSMLPVLETQEMKQALQVHRFAGLATAVLAIVHGLSLLAGRLGYR